MVTDDAQLELLQIYESFPGIVTPARDVHGSHLHLPVADFDTIVVVMSFENTVAGRAAELLVDFIMSARGGRKDTSLACDCAAEGSVFYGCTKAQLRAFARYLDYGSHRPMGGARPQTELSSMPLSVLLSHALSSFTRDYHQPASAEQTIPNLGIWSNVLRLLEGEGLDQRELGKLAILSRRASKVAVRNAAAQGWLTVKTVPKVRGLKVLQLTADGRTARAAGESRIDETEQAWRDRFGHERVDQLRSSLAALAGQFEIELPHYLTGYGPLDLQVTGGDHIPEQSGPPRIPAHGQEWPVVLCEADHAASDLPLPALLSQVLAAFTIDYERERLGWLATASCVLHPLDDNSTLGQLSASGVKGTGKPLLERHLIVVVEPGKPRDMNRRVYLTPKGRRMRDSYPYAVMEIEHNWNSRYGAEQLANLRTTLESLEDDFEPALPDYPNNTAWFFPWQWPNENQ